MSLPFENLDTTFEQLLQELPPDYRALAIEFKAFCRSRKIKTPQQLLRVMMSYCGMDAVLRETAGTFTLLEERISTAIHQRLKACGPWVKALLSRMMSDDGCGSATVGRGSPPVSGDRWVDGAESWCDRRRVSGASGD